MRLFVTLVLVCLLPVFAALAQDEACTGLIEQAVSLVGQHCEATERNEACYGNLQIELTPQENAGELRFAAPGDRVSLLDVQALSLSALTRPDEWGVALLRVQANLPDTLPGQNATLLLFGDVLLDSYEEQLLQFEVSSAGNVNLRSGPGTSYQVLGTLQFGDLMQASGRDDAGEWLFVTLEDGSTAWVFADLTIISGDKMALSVVDPQFSTAVGRYGPMQAFYFTSGIGSADCAEAPRDGILVQTPSGVGEIELLVNEVSLRMGSTLYLTAQRGAFMHIAVLQGQAYVSAFDSTVYISSGARARVPLDAEGVAAGPPQVLSYNDAEVGTLQALAPALPQPLEIAPALSPEELTALATTPFSGMWGVYAERTGQFFICLPNTFNSRNVPEGKWYDQEIRISNGQIELVGYESSDGRVFSRTTDCPALEGGVCTYTFTFESTGSVQIGGQFFFDDACPFESGFTMQYIGPAGE